MIRVKDDSVQIANLTPGMFFGLTVFDQVMVAHGKEYTTITSGHEPDTKHGFSSCHYDGNAVDIRSKNLATIEAKKSVVKMAKANLGYDYDVLLENIGKDNEHFHIEKQPHRRV